MSPADFTSASVEPVVREACRRVGICAGGPELMRLGENAIFRLREAPIVVRIARSADRLPRVEKELCVARWLTEAGVPSIAVEESLNQPILVDGHPVTFWRAADGVGPEPSRIDLAMLLKRFHSASNCPCDLPAFDPLRTSLPRLAAAQFINAEDRAFLELRCEELGKRMTELEYALPLGPIHGDAHTSNLLADRGQIVLLDFESSAFGPREWDLMPTAVAVDRYGLDEMAYMAFAESYGFDVREWPGYLTLREVRELTMTTWLMQNVRESLEVATEFKLRVDSLRTRDFTRGWNFF